MKVVLIDNIKALGQVGDIKEVRDGYARNFLIPRNLARPASEGAIKDVEQIKAKKLATHEMAQKEALEVADKLKDAVIELTVQANEKGTLFAAIEPEQIASGLSTLAGARIQTSSVQLPEPIKTIGEHSVTVDLTDEVSVNVTVKVSKS